MPNSNRELTINALLATLILLSGFFKLPSPLPGGDFQLSAPIAVLICALFGFKRYFFAGIVASLLGLLLGTANVFHLVVALVFRVVAGVVLVVGGVCPRGADAGRPRATPTGTDGARPGDAAADRPRAPHTGATTMLTLALAGPIGTAGARLALSLLTGVSWQVLVLAALPGMIFTAITSTLLYRPTERLLQRVSQRRN